MTRVTRPRMRDANEPEIIKALRAAGASVSQLKEGDGLPDLLVGYKTVTLLLEVKLPLGPKGGKQRRGGAPKGGDGVLSADQVKWWKGWQGAEPVIVRTVEEALHQLERVDWVFEQIKIGKGRMLGYPTPAPRRAPEDVEDVPR